MAAMLGVLVWIALVFSGYVTNADIEDDKKTTCIVVLVVGGLIIFLLSALF